MASDPARTLKEASRVDLAFAGETQRGHRNAAIFFALVSAVVIHWQGWNHWVFLLPASIAFYAIVAHISLSLITTEAKRRLSETQTIEEGPGSVKQLGLSRMVAGAPSLALLVLALLALWIYRFWILGWAALPGNLRVAALAASGLGMAGIIFGSMCTFGVRSRKIAGVLFVIATVAFLFFNLL